MSEPTSWRRAIIPIVVATVLAASIANWIWSEGANERRVDELLEMAYDYTELGGDQPTKLAHSENLNLGEAACGDLDDWYGGKTARKTVDGIDDVLAVAEQTARRFEDDGWSLVRYVYDDEPVPDRFSMVAERNDDRIEINYYQPNGISILAQSGPCVPRAGRASNRDATEVASFP